VSPPLPVPLSPAGTVMLPTTLPAVVISSRLIGAVTPKLGSTRALLNTCGYVPSDDAVAHSLEQPGGKTVWPGVNSPGAPT
jgi:hypothetical protein